MFVSRATRFLFCSVLQLLFSSALFPLIGAKEMPGRDANSKRLLCFFSLLQRKEMLFFITHKRRKKGSLHFGKSSFFCLCRGISKRKKCMNIVFTLCVQESQMSGRREDHRICKNLFFLLCTTTKRFERIYSGDHKRQEMHD